MDFSPQIPVITIQSTNSPANPASSTTASTTTGAVNNAPDGQAAVANPVAGPGAHGPNQFVQTQRQQQQQQLQTQRYLQQQQQLPHAPGHVYPPPAGQQHLLPPQPASGSGAGQLPASTMTQLPLTTPTTLPLPVAAVPQPVQVTMDNSILLAACQESESLPQNPEIPADLFTACLTTPIRMALRWHWLKHQEYFPGD
ncbi:unnamed protein product [Protopolystoma xenopodis]|uniref:Uncharacterized protein n=1 Tax=Protopolystoma xenopodis TaxID=117903 RepID=A0A3S5A6P6_9PLAT|nr:unnamed protein product [Protopolystoma xenopodis]